MSKVVNLSEYKRKKFAEKMKQKRQERRDYYAEWEAEWKKTQQLYEEQNRLWEEVMETNEDQDDPMWQ